MSSSLRGERSSLRSCSSFVHVLRSRFWPAYDTMYTDLAPKPVSIAKTRRKHGKKLESVQLICVSYFARESPPTTTLPPSLPSAISPCFPPLPLLLRLSGMQDMDSVVQGTPQIQSAQKENLRGEFNQTALRTRLWRCEGKYAPLASRRRNPSLRTRWGSSAGPRS